METLFQDVRFAARMLIKNPLVTCVAVITLALGIGANTAIFSTLNGFFLRPLPVAHADRLTFIGGQNKGGVYGGVSRLSYLDYRDLRSQQDAFTDLLAYNLNLVGIDYQGKPEPAVVSFVTANYFSGLGLQPALGSFISGAQAEEKGTEPVVVLGYSYWRKRFNSDPGIVGEQVKVNGTPATVIGVAPQGFHGLYSVIEMQAYLPLGLRTAWADPNNNFWTERGSSYQLSVYGVLKPGVTIQQAQTSVDVIMRRLASQYPEDKDFGARVYPERMARPEPDPDNSTFIVAVLFMILAGLVLLLACSNVANIIMVRATARSREMAVRSALGASRLRLARQLMTESILLAGAGGVAGLLLGVWISNLLGSIQLVALGSPLRFDFSFDWRVFTFGMLAALFTGVLVGLTPAVRLSRGNLSSVLHEGSRGVLAGTARSRFRSALVVVQVAGSLMLLVVAGLFVRSTRNAEHLYLGFDPSHVLNATMDVREAGLNPEQGRRFFRDLEQRMRNVPGLESVSVASSIPMGYSNDADPIYLEGKATDVKGPAPTIFNCSVSQDYFTTMKIPLLRGRFFTDQDNDKAPRVAVINEAMAQKFWPNQDPLGKRFSIKAGSGPLMEIVGLVKTGKYTGPGEAPTPFFYMPQEQNPASVRTLQVRTAGAPESLIPQVEREVHMLAPSLPLFGVESMEQSLEGANGFFLFRMGSRFAGALGLLGLALALVGVYGVISYVAAQRTHEIGVRMALGASRVTILRMILKQGVFLVGSGLAIGLLLTVAAARGIGSLLVGVSPTDPLTLGLSAVFLATVGIVASFIPARRAMNVEPLRALKYE